MTPPTILERIRYLFASEQNQHLDRISDAFRNGTLQEPANPMSDQELARAIREFRAKPVSDWTIAKLSRRFVEVPDR
ncbi:MULTISPECIES: hypothetical protein [unclassified Bradyrhizobium]|uniref:hypothetical protein n=1 Tax=unclassified Bradyrhizobium TaxID=2631580 RepID=UPI0002AAAC29|nr:MULTISPECIES: hypothetical protein [unclassified Bradyrhizobium]AMA57809.1 hypothetical protein BCCGELA001_17055 [Bradyrhizobium sp. CCGE-LA001]KYG99967.1 hypothetical protein SE91_16975 [Bradyrhizobium sp. DOA1]